VQNYRTLQKKGKAASTAETFRAESFKETAFEVALSSIPETFPCHQGET